MTVFCVPASAQNEKTVISQNDAQGFFSCDDLSEKKQVPLSWREVSYLDADRKTAVNEALDRYEELMRTKRQYASARNPLEKETESVSVPGNQKFDHRKDEKTSGNPLISRLPTNAFVFDDNHPMEAKMDLSAGWREDDFLWNISGDISGCCPNILSELTWEDVRMIQYKTQAEVMFGRLFIVEASGAISDIYRGENQDSDYLADNRSLEFSRSNNSANDGEAFDYSGGLGIIFPVDLDAKYWGTEKIWMKFLGGYSRHELNLVMQEGTQTVGGTLGPFSGLNSRYWATWQGPWSGIELQTMIRNILASIRFEYHWADFDGAAEWNLRTDFEHPVSFIHRADGRGYVLDFDAEYAFDSDWSLALNVSYQDWLAENGLDRTFFSNGARSDTNLREVTWDSYAIQLAATYRFP